MTHSHDPSQSSALLPTSAEAPHSCCSATRQATCCEPTEKASCCGPRPDAPASASGSCGCQP